VEPLTEVGDLAFELLTDAAEDEAGEVPADATELAELPLVALSSSWSEKKKKTERMNVQKALQIELGWSLMCTQC